MKHDLQTEALKIIEDCKDLALATVRPDGFPQATTVSFVHDGLNLYFGCGRSSQKAQNLLRDPRASVTMTAPYESWDDIRGLSLAVRAKEMTTSAEIAEIAKMMVARFPQIANMEPVFETDEVCFFRLTPFVASVLDYSKGFGHADTATVDDEDIAETLESHKHRWLIPVP